MRGWERDELELGPRAARYLVVDNDLPAGARIVAIEARFLDLFSKDRSRIND